jgi:hypothetical protein
MSFNLQEPTTFINIKLTDQGRRMLSLGALSFNKAVLSDREVDYSIDRTGDYIISNNRVLAPAEFYPEIEPYNLDGTSAFNLNGQQVSSAKQFLTADTPSSGFFSGGTDAWYLISQFAKGKTVVDYGSQTWNSTGLTVTIGSYTPQTGDLVWIPWPHPSLGYTFNSDLIASGKPTVALWYKVVSGGGVNLALDRPIPKFNGATTTYDTTAYYFPDNGIANYYGSAATQDCQIWNLNIVRTGTVAGTILDVTNFISGYTQYGSIEYAGTRRYFGFSSETPAVGFVHYTNESSGNTYAEQFIEKSIQIYIPTIMWYNTGENNGEAIKWGSSFFDYYGQTFYDSFAKTTYRELRDGIYSSNKVVGRVYHKLKLIVITDQELLTVLSHKSNRNYALPDYNINLTSTPKNPLSNNEANGLCRAGYDYFITYRFNNSAHTTNTSFGYPDSQHCGYIKKITGQNDINNNPQFLQLTFSANAFPYMRNDSGFSTYGTGWNANNFQVLINEQPSSLGYDSANVPSDSWIAVSDLGLGGNGVYRAVDVGDNTIDANKLNGYSFIISKEDYLSGSTYQINSGLTQNQEHLNYGDESFFFGTIDLQIFATTYKSIITVYAKNTDVNSSINPTYNPNLDENTYITEVAILDNSNQVVAVGKPTYPIKKSNGRFLAFQLEIDF